MKMKLADGRALTAANDPDEAINPTPGEFIRAKVNRRLKVIICTPKPEILDKLAQAAKDEEFRLPIAKIVALSEAIQLVTVASP